MMLLLKILSNNITIIHLPVGLHTPVAPIAQFNPGTPLAQGPPLATADPTALVAPGIPTPRAPAGPRNRKVTLYIDAR